jgi:competence protein ComEC
MLSTPSLPLFLALALGISLAELCPLPIYVWAVAAGLAALGTGLAATRRRFTAIGACACMLAGGGLWVRGLPQPTLTPLCGDHASPRAPGSLFRLRVAGPVNRAVDGKRLTQQTVVELVDEACEGRWQPRRGRVAVHLRPGQPVRRGDLLLARLRVQATAPAHNPHQADPLRRARAAQWVGRAQVRSDHALLAPGTGPAAWLDALRANLAGHFEAKLSVPHAGLAKALVLGDGSSISTGQRDAWADAGMAHLLSVSGLHVGIVSAALLLLCRFGVRALPTATWALSPHRLAALLALVGVVGFCLLTGASAPAVRAGLMGGLAAAGVALGLPSRGRNAWGVAGICMLMQAPLALFEVGFLLSFAAVAALLWGGPRSSASPLELAEAEAADGMAPRPPPPPWFRRQLGRLGRAGLGALWLSGAATLVTLPLCASAFGRVSLVAPASNLLAVPLGSLVATPLALGCALLSLGPPLAWVDTASHLGLALLTQVLSLLERLATGAASLPGAALNLPPMPAWACVLYAGGLWALCCGSRKQRAGVGVAGGLVLGVSLYLAHVPPPPLALAAIPPPRPVEGDLTLEVRHLYVGQGDATLVRLPHGRYILVDGGGAVLPQQPDPGRLTVVPLLRHLGVQRLELMVLTHPHPDHVGGLVAVSQAFDVAQLWYNGTGDLYAPVRQTLAQVRAAGGTVRRAADLPPTFWLDGVRIDVLHPRPPQPGQSTYKTFSANDNSIVLRLQYGSRAVLLSGDIEASAEALLQDRWPGPVDVLKVPHHGSQTSSSMAFLSALQPAAAVISCGEDNTYGFPHPATLQRYDSLKIPVFRTDVHGMLTYRTDGTSWSLQRHRL